MTWPAWPLPGGGGRRLRRCIVHRNAQIVNGRKTVCPAARPRLIFSAGVLENRGVAVVPNLGGMARVGYVLAGVALAGWGLFGANAVWVKILSLALGGALIVEGLVGF